MINYLQHRKISYLFLCQGSSDDDGNRFEPQLWLNIDFSTQLLGVWPKCVMGTNLLSVDFYAFLGGGKDVSRSDWNKSLIFFYH